MAANAQDIYYDKSTCTKTSRCPVTLTIKGTKYLELIAPRTAYGVTGDAFLAGAFARRVLFLLPVSCCAARFLLNTSSTEKLAGVKPGRTLGNAGAGGCAGGSAKGSEAAKRCIQLGFSTSNPSSKSKSAQLCRLG